MTKSNIALLALSLLVVAVLATKNHYEVDYSMKYLKNLKKFEVDILKKDSLINELFKYEKDLELQITNLSKTNDSLLNAKRKVKVYYEKIYLNIDHATNVELDSSIRTNW